VLIRDVAYGQIPRAARGRKHRHAAKWIVSLAPDRLADRADLLAHHYTAALELARATGEDTTDLERLAREALRAAGEHAAALGSFAAAERHFRDALALWPDDSPGHGSLPLAHGRTKLRAYDEGGEEFAAARAALLDEGDAAGAAEAETLLGEYEWMRGRTEQALEYTQAAARRVEGLPASASTTYVLGNLARYLMIAGRSAEAIEPGRAALAFARELGLEDREAAALNALGTSRVNLGDRGGLEDLRASIALAERIGSYEAVRSYINLASTTSDLGDLGESRRLHQRGHELARQLGDLRGQRFIEAELAVSAFLGGSWDEAASGIETFLADVAGTPHYYEGIMRLLRGTIAIARGETVRGLEEIERAADHARTVTKEPQALLPTLAFEALARVDSGDALGAGAALDELMRAVTPAQLYFGSQWIYPAAVAFDELGRLGELSEMLPAEAQSRWHEAFRLHAAGDLYDAAGELAAIGSRTDEARLRLLAAERGGPEAREQLERALVFYRTVGATLYVRRGERLLPASA
jgi:tetratricopeptide (TPR) repeat protein